VEDKIAEQSLKRVPRKRTTRRWLAAAFGLLGLLLGSFFILRHQGLFFTQQSTQAGSIEKSIALLPFENISPNKDDAYFADGVQDEILNNLAKVAQLKVISRTSVYGAAKTGVVSLTKSLAISFAEDGIRVNAIAPGWIKTEMTRALRENLELSEFRSKVVARIPGGQWAEPEDLAGAAIFLASSASKLINGVTIPVDGGYSANYTQGHK
jgi:NAD(P)-dependent dehydrogenase (short-subunit alcohol dehydrogenase family)